MTGGMADLLAAHSQGRPWFRHGVGLDGCICGWVATLHDDQQWHHQHVFAVLTAAGFGDTRALLDDLRALADEFARRERTCHERFAGPYTEGCRDVWDLAETTLLALLARHTPPSNPVGRHAQEEETE